MYSCAFTGHRPARFVFKYDETHPSCDKIKGAIKEECRRLYEQESVRTFITGCALGVDIWGAEAVLELRLEGYSDIRLVCAIPFPNHDEKWNDKQKQRLWRILDATDEFVIICQRYSQDAYKRRNYYMVDNAQFLIAVFDQEKNARSGTKQTMNYARSKGLKITLIHPAHFVSCDE